MRMRAGSRLWARMRAKAASTLAAVSAAMPAALAAAAASSAAREEWPAIWTAWRSLRQRRQGLQEGDRILGVEHAEDEMQRARLRAVLLALRAEEIGQRLAGGFVMAAVEPELPAGRQAPASGPRVRRCSRAGHSTSRRPRIWAWPSMQKPLEEGQAGERGAGIGNLMRAGKGRQRQLALARRSGKTRSFCRRATRAIPRHSGKAAPRARRRAPRRPPAPRAAAAPRPRARRA